jgi:small-conductance mechanosensitive channel
MSACNLALILLALWGRDRPLSVLAAGAFIAALFLAFLSQRARANGS